MNKFSLMSWGTGTIEERALPLARLGALSAVSAWFRSLSLAAHFAAVAGIVILAGMLVLSAWLVKRVEKGVISYTVAGASIYVGYIEPNVQELAHGSAISQPFQDELTKLVNGMALGRKVVDIKIWGMNGDIVFSRNAQLIGRRFAISKGLASALLGNVAPEYDRLDDEGDEPQRALNKPIIEIYAPLRETGSDRIIGAAEVYELAEDVDNALSQARIETGLIVGSLTLLMITCLFGIVLRGSRLIEQQHQALRNQVNELSRALEQNRVLRRRVSAATRRASETSERFLRRVGADLHDGPAQLISLALLRLDQLQPGQSSQPEQSNDAEIIQGALEESLNEIRNISLGLALPELNDVPTAQALDVVVRNHERRTGTTVAATLDIPSSRHVPQAVKLCACRIVQEALNNCFRHAASAHQSVTASLAGDVLEVSVSDTGPGFEHNPSQRESGKLGLSGMMDRVESLGGTLNIDTRLGVGTRISVRLPITDGDVRDG